MRYRLRTLTALTMIVPPVFAALWLGGGAIVLAMSLYMGLVVLAKRFVFSDRAIANRAR
jgi:hypothetical protein